MRFASWQVKRILEGVRLYGLDRTLGGLIDLLKLMLQKPAKGVVVTENDHLSLHFLYPQQLSHSLVLFREFVEPEFELLRQILTKDTCFFDVGGAIGTYSLFVAQFVDGPVYTFEPVAENVQMIHENLCANGLQAKVKVLATALSDQDGFSRLEHGEKLFYSRLQQVTALPLTDTVRVTTLQNYCLQEQIDHIDVLKLDTEGHTLAILHGTQSMLANQQIDLLIVEMDKDLIDIHQLLTGYCYTCWAYDKQRRALLPITAQNQEIAVAAKRTAFHSNIVFIHQNALSKYYGRVISDSL